MKRPKDILLDRHRKTEPSLDRIRTEVRRALESRDREQASAPPSPPEPVVLTLWRELFLTCRRYWMGLGTVWCVIVLFAALGGGNGAGSQGPAIRPSEPAIQALRERQRLRAELLGPATTAENTRAARREEMPGPRSEATGCFANV